MAILGHSCVEIAKKYIVSLCFLYFRLARLVPTAARHMSTDADLHLSDVHLRAVSSDTGCDLPCETVFPFAAAAFIEVKRMQALIDEKIGNT